MTMGNTNDSVIVTMMNNPHLQPTLSPRTGHQQIAVQAVWQFPKKQRRGAAWQAPRLVLQQLARR
jgi:hypothetical protein